MLHYGILAVLWSVMTCSFGFTINRSVALVPSTWDTAPSLDTYRKIFVDPALDSRMQITGMDKILRAADTKVSTKLMEKTENQTREKRSTTENIAIETKLVNDEASAMRNNASNSFGGNAGTIIAPRNVILLLIDERSQEERKEESPWKDYKDGLPFAEIEGFLQNCRNNIKTGSFPLDSKLISENKEKDCDCERILRSNIEKLLFWARQTRGMSTGAISGSNFSIPSFPKYELDGSNKSDAKLEPRKSKRDSNDAWQVIDLSNRAKAAPTLITADRKTEEGTNYDGAWDIFDVFSKIRMAFFHSLLESLNRNGGTSQNEFLSHKSFAFKPTVTNLIGNTIRELKSIPNDKGYMLIATVPRSEQAAVIDLLQREISPKDTLLVVTQICAENKKSVPFAARGPNNQILREAETVVELPIVIRKAIASDGQDQGYANRQKRDIPIISHMPIFSERFPEQKRVIRDNGAVEKLETSKLNDTNVKDLSAEGTITIGKEKQARSSTSLQTTPCGLVITFGGATSILIMDALTSS